MFQGTYLRKAHIRSEFDQYQQDKASALLLCVTGVGGNLLGTTNHALIHTTSRCCQVAVHKLHRECRDELIK